MPLEFVTLHHTGIPQPHYDLLFEYEADAAALTALRCPRWPPAVGDEFEELAEHRRHYLSYEGPISEGRGEVRQVACGTLEISHLTIDPPTLGLRLQSSAGASCVELTLCERPHCDGSMPRWVVDTVLVTGG